MKRPGLLAGLAVLALSLFVLSGTAFAHSTHHKKAKPRAESSDPGSSAPETCVVHALPPRFMDQGEFGSASSVADIIEVECEEVYAEKHVRISANELYSRCDKKLYWRTPFGHDEAATVSGFATGSSFSVELDNDGNATAIVVGGPSCAPGESLISAHLEVPPFTTVTTPFTVDPPRPPTEQEQGVVATPDRKVEGEIYSDVATILQVRFDPVFAEEPVWVDFAQVYARCHRAPHTEVITMGDRGFPLVNSETESETLFLDNDGNAFAVLIGNSSCAAGRSLIEASLENAPYTTKTTTFTIDPPRPTFPE